MGWLDRLSPPKVQTKGFTVITDDGFIPQNQNGYVRLYTKSPDDALDANVVMSPVNWILRNFTEAEAIVQRRRGDVWEEDEENALTATLMRPNPYYGDSLLWKASVLSFCFDGNAYWQKVRNSFGKVLGYWYLPHFLVDPKWPDDGSAFISHYEYRPENGKPPVNLKVENVVHFRAGLDPCNPRKGMSALKPLLREVFTDEEASSFSAAILGNMGVPGGIVSPKSADSRMNKQEVDRVKEHMKSFTGSRRGEWLAFGVPTDVQQFGYDPNNLMLGNLRDIAEERVCAALGVPAAVVGFGSGLQQTKVGATMRELRKEAWNSCIRPMQSDMAKQLGMQLLPDFVTQLKRYRVRFDTSDFSASQEEEKEKAERIALLVKEGVLRVDRAQAMLGLEVDPSRQVYLGPAPAPDEPEEPAAAPAVDQDLAAIRDRVMANGNGNGRNGNG
jgi:HK97 family phage portal protein